MSRWSYVTGWILVSPLGRTQEEAEYILKTVLNHLPIVRGSEEEMYVHIIQAGGHDMSCSCDEYGDTTNNLIDWYGHKSRRGSLILQTSYYLFIEGHFRDREFDETYRQFVKWLTRLSKRIHVYDTDVIVKGDFGGKSVRINTDLFEGIWEIPTWSNWKDKIYYAPYEDYDFNWCEHLMWDIER